MKKFFYDHKTFFYALFIIAATSFVINNVAAVKNAADIVNGHYNDNDGDISTRIEVISNDLLTLSSELSSIQSDLEHRINLVEYLKREAETAENLLSLSSEQLETIRAEWKQTIDSNSKKSLGQNLIINMIFFILGLIIPTIKNSIKKETTSKSTKVNEETLKKIIQQAIDIYNESETVNSSTTQFSNSNTPRRLSHSDYLQRHSDVNKQRKKTQQTDPT